MKQGADMGHSPGMDSEMESPVGARKFAASIRSHFGDNASDQRGRQPTSKPAPVQLYSLDGNKM